MQRLRARAAVLQHLPADFLLPARWHLGGVCGLWNLVVSVVGLTSHQAYLIFLSLAWGAFPDGGGPGRLRDSFPGRVSGCSGGYTEVLPGGWGAGVGGGAPPVISSAPRGLTSLQHHARG